MHDEVGKPPAARFLNVALGRVSQAPSPAIATEGG
jgi:hypothetical protein